MITKSLQYRGKISICKARNLHKKPKTKIMNRVFTNKSKMPKKSVSKTPKKTNKNNAKKEQPKHHFGKFIAISAIAIGGLIVLNMSLNERFGFAALIQGDVLIKKATVTTPSFIIDPQVAELKIGESITFSSYEKRGTSQVPYNSNWTVENAVKPLSLPQESKQFLDKYSDTITKIYVLGGTSIVDEAIISAIEGAADHHDDEAEYQKPVRMQNCENSPTCTIFTKDDSGSFIVTAQRADGKKAAGILNIKEQVKENPFNEVIPEWAQKVVLNMQERGIMKGYDDGRFGVSDPVTRSQLAVLLNNVMKEYFPPVSIDTANCNVFTDVPDNHFAFQAICYANSKGWFNNIQIKDGNFDPNKPLTRKEVATMIYNAAGSALFEYEINKANLNPKPTKEDIELIGKTYCSVFNDVGSASDATKTVIGTVASLKLMSGVNDTKNPGRLFQAEKEINRVETAVTLWNLMKRMDLYGKNEITDLSVFVEEQ